MIEVKDVDQVVGLLIQSSKRGQVQHCLREFEHGGETVHGVIDEMRLDIGRYNDEWSAQTILKVFIGAHRGYNMIVKGTPVIPGQENGSGTPERLVVHDRIDLLHRPVLAYTDTGRGMVAHTGRLHQPADRRKRARGGIFNKLRVINDMLLPLLRIADILDCIVGRPFVAILILSRRLVFPGNTLRA